MDLPVGYQEFHKEKFYNYQMNRLHALGYARAEDISEAARAIKTPDDYVRAFTRQAEKALEDGRLQNAAFYLRGAEFFTPQTSPQREAVYRRFRETFYEAFAGENFDRFEVPYEGSFLPAMMLPSLSEPARGTILLFGGFDSLIEEFFVIWKTLAEAGYRVIAFDGPGQGGARLLYGRLFDHDWEKPVAAVLDYFKIDEAALIGISMGGYWAIRAAAYEPRIKQVVSWSPVYDWLEQIPPFAQSLVKQVIRWEGFMNATIRLRMRLFPILDHAVRHAMFLVDGDAPMDAVRWLLGMNREHISSDKVTQDVLLMVGADDTFQPPKLAEKQREALVNARSTTTRIFTADEQASMHCQMGNLNLAIGEIISWLAAVGEERPESIKLES